MFAGFPDNNQLQYNIFADHVKGYSFKLNGNLENNVFILKVFQVISSMSSKVFSHKNFSYLKNNGN